MCPCYARKFVRRALVVVAKAPRAGQTKTRLAPPLTLDSAADLYRAFLLDTLSMACALEWERIALIHPRGDGPGLQPLARGIDLVEQPGHGIGDALRFAFEHHFSLGFERVVLIGSDNPTLSAEPLIAAERADDVAIGPTRDGGYYLIGMRQPHLGLFSGIDWSTSRVYAQTLQRARELGLRVESVQEWYDVDERADLDHLVTDLRTLPPTVALNTRDVLGRWDEHGWARARAEGVGSRDALADLSGVATPNQDHH